MKYFILLFSFSLTLVTCKKDPGLVNKKTGNTNQLVFIKELDLNSMYGPNVIATTGDRFLIINTIQSKHPSNTNFEHSWYDQNFTVQCTSSEQLYYGGVRRNINALNGKIYSAFDDNFRFSISLLQSCGLPVQEIFHRQDTGVINQFSLFRITQKGNILFTYHDSLYCIDTLGNSKWRIAQSSLTLTAYRDACEISTGDFLLLGERQPASTVRDFCLTRIDKNGNISWQKLFGGPYYDEAQALLYDDDNRIFLAGHSNSWTNNQMHDALIIRTNANGDSLQYKTFGTMNHDGIQRTEFFEDKIIVTGYRDPDGTGKEMVFATLLDKSLNVLQQADATFSSNHRPTSCAILGHTFAVCGDGFVDWFQLSN
jgi:hypothetical protein